MTIGKIFLRKTSFETLIVPGKIIVKTMFESLTVLIGQFAFKKKKTLKMFPNGP